MILCSEYLFRFVLVKWSVILNFFWIITSLKNLIKIVTFLPREKYEHLFRVTKYSI